MRVGCLIGNMRDMNQAINVGDTVTIKGGWSHDNIFAGEWGVVKMIEDGVYHVGLYGGDHAPIFRRNELKKDKVNYITRQPQ